MQKPLSAFRLRAHSIRSVTSSWALARGTSLTDICRTAGWATLTVFSDGLSTFFVTIGYFCKTLHTNKKTLHQISKTL